MTYHPYNVDTATFSRDAVAGISVEYMDCSRFPFSIGWFSVFDRQLISDFTSGKATTPLYGGNLCDKSITER